MIGKTKWVLLVVAAGSLLFRAAYAVELWSSPVLVAHRFQGSDMEFFDRWARAIAAGDWWGKQELHPFAPWQRAAATEYLRRYPDEAQALVAGGVPENEGALARALWSRWYGGKRLHQEPLYAYLVAITYKLLGPDPRWVFLWQLLLGAATNVLVFLVARRAAGDLAGAVAGLLALFYAPLLAQEMVLLRTTLAAFTITLAVLLLERAFDAGGARRFLAAGAGLGVALLCQLPMALVALFSFAVLAWRARLGIRAALRDAAPLALGIALPLSPIVLRNVVVGIAPLTYVSVGTQTYLPHAIASYDPRSGGKAYGDAELAILHQTGGSFPAAVREAWKTFDGAGARLKFYAGKLGAALSWYEEADNQSFYYLRMLSPTLRRLPLTFAVVGPLALLGVVALLLRGSLRGAWLAATALTGILVLVLTIPIARYRAPYLPAMIALAGLGVAGCVEALSQRRFSRLAVLGAAGAGAAALVLWPLPPGKPLLRGVDWSSPYLYYYGPAATSAARAGRWDQALELLDEFLQRMPAGLAALARKPDPTRADKDLVCFYADVTAFQAAALEKTRRAGGVPRELVAALGSGCQVMSAASPR